MVARRSGWLLFVGIAAVAASADLISKHLVFARLGMPRQQAAIEIVPGILSLETNLNEGALFGLGQGMGVLFAAISVLAILGILAMVARPGTRANLSLLAALGLITGGIVGNLFDRLGLPGMVWHEPASRAGSPVVAVRDWIHFQLPGWIDWPVFNLADSWLVIGAALLLWISLWTSQDTPDPASADDPPAATPSAGQTARRPDAPRDADSRSRESVR